MEGKQWLLLRFPAQGSRAPWLLGRTLEVWVSVRALPFRNGGLPPQGHGWERESGEACILSLVAILFFQFVGPPVSTLLDLTGLLAISGNSEASALQALAHVIPSALPLTSQLLILQALTGMSPPSRSPS